MVQIDVSGWHAAADPVSAPAGTRRERPRSASASPPLRRSRRRGFAALRHRQSTNSPSGPLATDAMHMLVAHGMGPRTPSGRRVTVATSPSTPATDRRACCCRFNAAALQRRPAATAIIAGSRKGKEGQRVMRAIATRNVTLAVRHAAVATRMCFMIRVSRARSADSRAAIAGRPSSRATAKPYLASSARICSGVNSERSGSPSRRTMNAITGSSSDRPQVHHDELAPRRRAALDDGERGLDVRALEVHHDALPDPGRRARRIVTGRGQRVVEPIAREVDRHEAHLARDPLQRRRARLLLALRVGMVDLEHRDVAQLRHPPGAPVETGAQDHDLRRRRRRAPPRRSRPCARPSSSPACRERRAPGGARRSFGRHARAKLFDAPPRLLGQQRQRRRVLEVDPGRPAVRRRARGGHQHGGLALASRLHALDR